MEVQYENPYEVGMTGLLGMPSGYYSMHEAEVLLMLGTDFPYSAFLPDDIKIAQIDIKPERLGRRAKVDIGLCGDVKMTIQALLRMLTPKTDDTFLLKQLKRYEEVKKDLAAYTKDKGEVNKIHPEYVMSEIDKLSSDDAVFTVDTGMTCVWERGICKRQVIATCWVLSITVLWQMLCRRLLVLPWLTPNAR